MAWTCTASSWTSRPRGPHRTGLARRGLLPRSTMTEHRPLGGQEWLWCRAPPCPVRQGGGKGRRSQRAGAIQGRRVGLLPGQGFASNAIVYTCLENALLTSCLLGHPRRGVLLASDRCQRSPPKRRPVRTRGEAHVGAGSSAPDTCEARDVRAVGPRPHLKTHTEAAPKVLTNLANAVARAVTTQELRVSRHMRPVPRSFHAGILTRES